MSTQPAAVILKRKILVSCVITAVALYSVLGAWRYLVLAPSLTHQDTKKLVQLLDNPTALITKVQQSLQKSPTDHQGWYVLARLYAAQGAWDKAQTAITNAQQIASKPSYKQFEKDLALLKTKATLPKH